MSFPAHRPGLWQIQTLEPSCSLRRGASHPQQSPLAFAVVGSAEASSEVLTAVIPNLISFGPLASAVCRSTPANSEVSALYFGLQLLELVAQTLPGSVAKVSMYFF